MSDSLSNLTENLKESDPTLKRFTHSLPFIRNLFKSCEGKTTLSETEFTDMMLRKGVYFYSYVTNAKVLQETEFPPLEAFRDFLTQRTISQSEYEHGLKVWKETQCRTLKDYHDLYLRMDVHLLSDVFLNFRRTLQEKFGLDCCHYMTLPSFSWDAMLKFTKAELELLDDYEMLCFTEKGKRGGLCFVNHRHATSNDPRCVSQYDPAKPTSQILYLDANNLYGGVMGMHLPKGNFKWIAETEKNGGLEKKMKGILRESDESSVGYLCEVDLHFPEAVHDKLRDYPPCPENLEISYENLSPYNREILELELGAKRSKSYKSSKLTPHLMDHKNYVIDYRLLKKAVELGIEITKVHRILSFDQSAWLKPYIEKNSEYRRQATNDFDKNVFKLLNNCIYGKTCENIRNRRHIEITANHAKALRYASRPTFKHGKFEDDMYYLEMCKESITYDRPSYVGISVLDLSKKCMLDFHYDFMVNHYESKQKLLYSDTDSLVYHVETKDVFEDISNEANRHLFDLSNMPKDSKHRHMENAKTPLKMKSETGCTVIDEMVALRPKSYCMDIHGEESRTCKGVQRFVVKNVLKNEDYHAVLETGKPVYAVNRGFVSKTHQIFSYECMKKSVSAFYDKMHVCDDAVTCIPYGHYSLDNYSLNKQKKNSTKLYD